MTELPLAEDRGAAGSLHRFLEPQPAAGTWTSPWIEPSHPICTVVPSWNARVPAGSLLVLEVQGRVRVRETAWYELARWTEGEGRTSVPGQADADGGVDVDTLSARDAFDAVRLRASLTGPGTAWLVTAALSGRPGDRQRPSSPGRARGTELDVPVFSQRPHASLHLDTGGGGEAWCSPACVAMVVASWGGRLGDEPVVTAAQGTYDAAYGGCGNWSFNMAYAGGFGLEAFVDRLADLAAAEAYLAEGIPLVLSIAAAPGALDGFPLAAGTRGHLVVVRGITDAGDAIVNDPAAADGDVRRVYDRAQLERAWLEGSGGIAYVVRPRGRRSSARPVSGPSDASSRWTNSPTSARRS